MNLNSIAKAILSLPKSERMAWIERWPADLQDPIKERIRLIHGGWRPEPETATGDKHSAFRVYIQGRRHPLSMIVQDRATVEEAMGIAGQVFLRNTVERVEVVRRTVNTHGAE